MNDRDRRFSQAWNAELERLREELGDPWADWPEPSPGSAERLQETLRRHDDLMNTVRSLREKGQRSSDGE